jgi:hypothetical protein
MSICNDRRGCESAETFLEGKKREEKGAYGESRSLGDGQPEVEGDATRNATETDEDPPGVVNVGPKSGVVVDDLGLEAGGADEADESGEEVTPSLSGENGGLSVRKEGWESSSVQLEEGRHIEHDRCRKGRRRMEAHHHSPSGSGGSEFGSDGCRERVVSSDAETHEELDEGTKGKGRQSACAYQMRLHGSVRRSKLTRHITRTPMRETPGPWPATACPRVPIKMIMSWEEMPRRHQHDASRGKQGRMKVKQGRGSRAYLDSVELLSSEDVGKPSEQELTDKSSNRSCYLDA